MEGPKGQFAVEQIKVAEAMEKELFGKEFAWAFQVSKQSALTTYPRPYIAQRRGCLGHFASSVPANPNSVSSPKAIRTLFVLYFAINVEVVFGKKGPQAV